MSDDAGAADEAQLAALLAEAKRLARVGSDEAAKAAYLLALRQDATDPDALVGIARLALRSGHRSAARTALAHAVACHPANLAARLNLGEVLLECGDLQGAREAFAAAVAAQPDAPAAHQGLARALSGLGDPAAAEPHWRRAFQASAAAPQPYHGAGAGIPLLLLVCAKGGNIPTRALLDDTRFAVTALFADHHRTGAPLPPHAVIFNAIGDADLCADALRTAQAIVAQSSAPVVNPPALVARTGRVDIAERMRGADDVVVPAIRRWSRQSLLAAAGDLAFPLLARSPGFHTGQHFVRIERRAELADKVAGLPGETLLAIEPLGARGADGLYRKHRVMFIDGAIYPLHLALSHDWKVHYFSGAMSEDAAYRAEEARFLADMPGALGPRAMAGLAAIRRRLGLDYAGVDFAVGADGRLLLFEANAGMVIQPPGPEAIWDYRREPTGRALAAVKAMIERRAEAMPAPPSAAVSVTVRHRC